MRQIYLVISFAAVSLVLVACGKFSEKFSRLKKDYTMVSFQPDRNSFQTMTTQAGGVMVYLVNQSGGNNMVLGFADETMSTTPVAVPNGTYKIYALGYQGPPIGGGQVRCGYVNSGSALTFNGTAQSATVVLNQTTCTFGTAGDFASVANANEPSNTNFDQWQISLCSGNPYPSCTASSASTHGVKVTLMAGAGGSGASVENSAQSLVSACKAESSGSFSFTGNYLNTPVGASFPIPIKIEFYADTSCSTTVSRTYTFGSGLGSYTSGTSASTVYVRSPASSNTTYVEFYQDF